MKKGVAYKDDCYVLMGVSDPYSCGHGFGMWMGCYASHARSHFFGIREME